MDNHILIGIGGTGGKILKAFRKRMFQEYSEEERRKLPIGFIYVDSTKEMMDPKDQTWKVMGQDSRLGKDNFLYIREASLGSQLASVENYPGISKWIGSKKIWSNIVGNVGDDGAAAQKRRLGRFLFSCSANDYRAILTNQVKRVQAVGSNEDVTFHVFAGLAGGTGSGSVVDLVAQTRKEYPAQAGRSYKIILYCQIPERSPLPNWDKGLYHANGYAALTELNALKVGAFKPHDVTAQFEFVPCDENVYNAAFIYTNANENGKIINTKDELPVLVSDLAFHYITLREDNNTRDFKDCYSTENVDPKDEFDENAENKEDAVPVRSKVFKAFGLKRIVNPESEIQEFLTYTMARQALYQFKYNNWTDDQGYCDEPKNEDYRSKIAGAEGEAFRHRVCLTESQLMLSEGILESEIAAKWKTIEDDWKSIVPKLSMAAWQNNESQALSGLTTLCNQRFDQKFREVGVKRFYELKERSKNEIAQEIRKKVEKDFFELWLSGKEPMSAVIKRMVVLNEYLDEMLDSFEAATQKKSRKLSELTERKAQMEQEWAHTGFLGAAFGKKKNIYQDYTTNLEKICILRTEIEASEFAKKLLAQVKIELGELDSDIKEINNRFTKAVEMAEKQINVRCTEKEIASGVALKDAVVRYYDPEPVHQFATMLRLDKETQNSQNQAIRNRLAALCGEKISFTRLVEEAGEDMILEIMENECMNGVKSAHETLLMGRKPVIGKNIIDQLYEQYGSSDKGDALREFAENIINSAGVYLTFDQSEVGISLANNPTPIPQTNLMFSTVQITMPTSEKHKEFTERLKEVFRSCISGHKGTVSFATDSPRINEITVMSLTYSFPLRMVSDVKHLKTKYDLALPEGNDEVNRLVLHLEGDGRQYPSLFVEKFDPKNYLNDMLLGIAMGIIDLQESGDGTGRKSYCQLRKNHRGQILSTIVYGEKLSELHETESAKVADMRQLQAEVKSRMAEEYLHISKREELVKALVELGNQIFAERRSNPNDATYKLYIDCINKMCDELEK